MAVNHVWIFSCWKSSNQPSASVSRKACVAWSRSSQWTHWGQNLSEFAIESSISWDILRIFKGVSHKKPCPSVSTTPLRQWGFRQCFPFSLTTLRGKHCRHPIALMGVVDTFRPCLDYCEDPVGSFENLNLCFPVQTGPF